MHDNFEKENKFSKCNDHLGLCSNLRTLPTPMKTSWKPLLNFHHSARQRMCAGKHFKALCIPSKSKACFMNSVFALIIFFKWKRRGKEKEINTFIKKKTLVNSVIEIQNILSYLTLSVKVWFRRTLAVMFAHFQQETAGLVYLEEINKVKKFCIR